MVDQIADVEEPQQREDGDEKSLTTLRAAVAAHINGAPWDWIAERYGYSSPKACQVAIERFLGDTYSSSDAATARNKARARYERMLQGVMWDATHPFEVDDKGGQTKQRNEMHIPALREARGLVADIARLDGLNAPTQVQLYMPGQEELVAMVARLRTKALEGTAPEGDPFTEDAPGEHEEIVIEADGTRST